ncbi:metalloregulator ArsR/SmtB family transcription factor [Citrobacter freundii]|uniref:ArsR/SmtB family transcription factor n=1 Tax=Citrobacter freundii TaxID=546 RepID=UPI0023D531CE|nr:metalloregulator ArsR/SmtB family transcription factor [Citrobacter freundii]
MSSTSDCGNIQDCSATDHVAEPDLSMLSQNDIGQLSEIFHLLGDQSRLRILLYCIRGSVSVGDIAESLQLSQSLVSHHLRLLRSARLVRGERKGKYIFYSIMDHHVSHVLQDMVFHIAEE